ncbi:hypothetical protein ABEG18_12985 [Alsobacter sp. KACC 23698]|uniref:DUF2634 domain-containing protein n=1 Tax=Alsobacter sp. KACC 23698 TaxID=3149229 RepID=A0AAU7JNC8_9HYPH
MADVTGLSILPHNDVHLDESGNLVMAADAQAVGQHVRQRLMFWRSEWFLNTAAGIDWTRYVLGRPPSDQPIAEAIIKAEILATPGVTEILEFDVSVDRAGRGLKINRVVLLTSFDDDPVTLTVN